MTTNFKSAMQELSDAFTSRVTDHETTRGKFPRRWFLKDDSPDWMTSVLRDAHMALDGRMPDDWVYEAVASIASNLNVCDESDEAQDQVHEICDGLVDVYTSALTQWLASHLGNVALCDEAFSEYGNPDTDIDARIRAGQFKALTRIANSVIESISSEAESRDEIESEAS